MNSYQNNKIIPFLQNQKINTSTITSCPVNYRDKTELIYTCVCGNQVVRNSRNYQIRPLCDTPSIRGGKVCNPKARHGSTPQDIQVFIDLLAEEGYYIKDLENCGYKNTKTVVTTITPWGDEYKTSYASFVKKHRPKILHIKSQKLSINEVKTRIENAGFEWIEGTEYKAKNIPIPVLCHCGNKFDVAIENIRENRVGCLKCYMYNRKYPWDYIEGVADRYGCTLVSDRDIYKGRDTYIEILCACGEYMIRTVRNFLKAPRCKLCSTQQRRETNLKRYGNTEYFASDIGKEMIKNYWNKKHGVSHNMKVFDIQKKSQETCFKNFGVKCVLVTKEVREAAVKAHIEKWGDSPGNVLEIREKMKATNKEKLGVEYPLQSKEIHVKIRKNNLEKYGNELFIQSDAGKKLMIERYGVPYAMQVPEFFIKHAKSAFKLKEYRFYDSGNIIYVQGYEGRCIDCLLERGDTLEEDIIVSPSKVPVVNYIIEEEGINRRYFMDIYLPYMDKGIEVKSTWTFSKEVSKNKAKWVATSFICKGGIDIYVFSEKDLLFVIELKNGTLVKVLKYVYDSYAKYLDLYGF